MSHVSGAVARGVLRREWAATVDDYAIACHWALGGSLLVVGDAAGGLFGFEGTSGAVRWKHADSHGQGLLAMAAHPDGELFATAGQDGHVRYWRASDGTMERTVEVGRGWVEHVAWSPDGLYLAVVMSRRVHVFDREGNKAWQSEEHPSTVSAIAWAGSEQLATACYGRVAFLGASSGSLLEKLEWKGSLVSMALSPDGEIVACGSQDNSVHFWRRSTGEDSIMSGYFGKPSALAFDASGKLLATGGAAIVTVWSFGGDGPEGTRPGSLKLHVLPITTLEFSHRGRRLASGGPGNALMVRSSVRLGRG